MRRGRRLTPRGSGGSPLLRRSARSAAERRLKRFRQATILAVAITAFLLMLLAPGDAGLAQESRAVGPEPSAPEPDQVLPAAAEEAERTARELWGEFLAFLPKILVVLGTFAAAWVLARTIRSVLRASLRHWERAEAFATLAAIGIWILAVGIAVSVIAGDARALVGSLGLVGLALSWALQTPIESFAGWLMNSFRGYYRVGDRIAVGEIHGEVYSIDFLNTTLWEIGSPERDGYVRAEQPTGRLITFPNSEVLAGSIINFTRDFPWVWDELPVTIANESDVRYAMDVVARTAREVLGEYMAGPAEEYERILRRAGLERSVAREPEVFVSANDWGTTLTIRYLVGARERRAWKSRLLVRVNAELARDEHRSRIVAAYPRQQIQWIDPEGRPRV